VIRAFERRPNEEQLLWIVLGWQVGKYVRRFQLTAMSDAAYEHMKTAVELHRSAMAKQRDELPAWVKAFV
jgi:hypothetical protein